MSTPQAQWYVEAVEGILPVDTNFNSDLENAVQRGDRVASLRRRGHSYTVSFLPLRPDGTATASQTNDSTFRVRSLRRCPITDHVWEFRGNSSGWERASHSEYLEDKYRSDSSQTVHVGSPFGFRLAVDFARMTQTNLDTSRSRRVRRTRYASSSIGQTGFAHRQQQQQQQPATSSSSSTTGNVDHSNTDFGLIWQELKEDDSVSDSCAICLDEMSPGTEELVRPLACKSHVFHKACVLPLVTNGWLKCPICTKVSGAPQTGDQPDGEMRVDTVRSTLRVSASDARHASRDMFVITYSVPSGVQGPRHPSPGTPYQGTVRVAYLPASAEGREVLRLLRIAWDRRLVFTVGTSLTTGRANSVVWAGIHHKTSTSAGPYGYPDPTYLDRVRSELSQRGVS